MSTSTEPNILQVHDLNKRFGTVHAVKDLSFHVAQGEVFGFLGPNGAGKTTTMRMVTCFIPATSGAISVCGMDTRYDSLQIRKKIGYLAEHNPLYLDMQVKEYLAYVGEIRGLRGSILSSRLDEMYQVCGLTKMIKRQIGKLSKGYRQRVGLAQAMIHNPDLLILDEPMSGLDPNQIIEIRNLIKKVGAEKTVIYCSHILSEVAATCNRILIINNGTVVATGKPADLVSQTSKATCYAVRVKGDRTSIETRLSALPQVSAVTIEQPQNDWYPVRVSVESRDDLGEAIFQCALDNGWRLSELHRETISLEDVFTQLTRS